MFKKLCFFLFFLPLSAEVFEGYMRTRKTRRGNFKYQHKLNSNFAKEHYTPKETDLLERKEMFEEELYEINKELGIIYFDNTATTDQDYHRVVCCVRNLKEAKRIATKFQKENQ